MDYVTWTQVQTSNAGVCPSVIFQKGIIHFWVLDYLLPGRQIERKRADNSEPNIKIMGCVQKLGIAIGMHVKYFYTLYNIGLANKCPLGTQKKTKKN